jgi:polyphosphate kinase
VEAACPVSDPDLKKELLELLRIQLADNVKARILDGDFENNYVISQSSKKVRSQHEIYAYLLKKGSSKN